MHQLLDELALWNIDGHLVFFEVALEEGHRPPAKVGDRVEMDPAALARVCEMRKRLQLLHQRVDPDTGSCLHFADRQAAQTFELGHQLDAFDQRSFR